MSRRRISKFWFMDEKELKAIAKESSSIAEICRKLNVSGSGDQHKQIKKVLNERGIDYSHINIGLGSNAGRKFEVEKIPLKDILIKDSSYNRGHLKRRLIEEGLLKEQCRKCGLGNKWQGKEIALQLEHINGNGKDNRIENLEMLCPNCHSQTATWGNKKRHGSIG